MGRFCASVYIVFDDVGGVAYPFLRRWLLSIRSCTCNLQCDITTTWERLRCCCCCCCCAS